MNIFIILLGYIVLGWITCAVVTFLNKEVDKVDQFFIITIWPIYILFWVALYIGYAVGWVIYFPIWLLNKVIGKEK